MACGDETGRSCQPVRTRIKEEGGDGVGYERGAQPWTS